MSRIYFVELVVTKWHDKMTWSSINAKTSGEMIDRRGPWAK